MSQHNPNHLPQMRPTQAYPMPHPGYPGQYIILPPHSMYPQVMPQRPMYAQQFPYPPNQGFGPDSSIISVNRGHPSIPHADQLAPSAQVIPGVDSTAGEDESVTLNQAQQDKLSEDFLQFIIQSVDDGEAKKKPEPEPKVAPTVTQSKPPVSKDHNVKQVEKKAGFFKMDQQSLATCKAENAKVSKTQQTVVKEAKSLTVSTEKTLSESTSEVNVELRQPVRSHSEDGKRQGKKTKDTKSASQKPSRSTSMHVSVTPFSETSKTTAVENNQEDWELVENPKKKRKPKSDDSRSMTKNSANVSVQQEQKKSSSAPPKKRGVIPKEAITQKDSADQIRPTEVKSTSAFNRFSNESIITEEYSFQRGDGDRRRSSSSKVSRDISLPRAQLGEPSDTYSKKPYRDAESSRITREEAFKPQEMTVHVSSVKRLEKPQSMSDDSQISKIVSTPELKSKSITPSQTAYEGSEVAYAKIGTLAGERITYTRLELISLKDLDVSKLIPNICQRIHPKLLKINQSYLPGVGSGRRQGKGPATTGRTHCPWMNKKEALKNMPENEANEEKLLMCIRGWLNKLSETTFASVSSEVISGPIKTSKDIGTFVDRLYEKAIQDLKFIPLYARLCKAFVTKRTQEKSKFLPILTKKILNKARVPELEREFDQSILEANRNNPCIDTMITFLYEKEVTYKVPYRGNAELLAHLFCIDVVSVKTISDFIRKNFDDKDEFSIDLLLRVLTISGKVLESQDPSIIDESLAYFDSLKLKMPPKVNYRVADLRELRGKKWVSGKESGSTSAGPSMSLKSQAASSQQSNSRPDWTNGSSGGRNLSSISSSCNNKSTDRSNNNYSDSKPPRGSQSSHSYDKHGSSHSRRGESSNYSKSSHSSNQAVSASSSRGPRFFKGGASSQSAATQSSNSASIPSVSSASDLSIEALEEMRQIAKTQVTEFGSHQDVETADASLMSSDLQLHMHVYIQTAIEVYLEQGSGHLYVGNYFVHLLEESLLKLADLFRGVQECMQMMEDISIDVPNAFERLILLLVPLVCQRKVSLSQLYHFMSKGGVSDPAAHIVRLLIHVRDRLSLADAIHVWFHSGLKVEALSPPISKEKALEHRLDFLFTPKDPSVTKLKSQRTVYSLLSDEKVLPHEILHDLQDSSHHANCDPALHVIRSMLFSCPIGPGKLVNLHLKRTIKNNIHLFEWMSEKDKVAVVSMITQAHDYCHDNKHIPYYFCSSLTENLLLLLPSLIKIEDVQNICSSACEGCKLFQTDIKTGIQSFKTKSQSSSQPNQVDSNTTI